MFKTLLGLLLSALLISAIPTVIDAPRVLEHAQHLEHRGLLQITDEGFVYVKVSDDYIFETVKLLGKPQIQAPPYFGKGKVGAHISVIEASEAKGRRLCLPQLGKFIPFRIVNFAKVHVENQYGNREVYFFTVHSPDLIEIRKANGLSSHLHGYEFHITAAIEDYN